MKDKRNQKLFDKQKAELEQLIELHKAGHIDLSYCDESHFGLTPNVSYAWQHKEKPILLFAAKGKRLNILGFMTLDRKLLSHTFEGSVNSDNGIASIDELCKTIIRQTVIAIDNASIHRSKKFKAKIEEWRPQNLYIYDLPPYSLELNEIEIFFRFIKYQWLPFDAFLNFQNLKEQLENVLNSVGSKYCIDYLHRFYQYKDRKKKLSIVIFYSIFVKVFIYSI